ncbi:melanocortin receptor 4-like [Oculina patagonica]
MSVHWFWVVGWFVTFFGLVGNCWVIFIIAKRRRLQTTANWCVLSLAIADLGVTCGYFPASFVCNMLVHSCNNSLRFNFYSFFIEASMFALIAMIAERYIAIVYSLRYMYFMTTRKTVIIIVTSWGIPVSLFVARWAYEIYGDELSVKADRIIVIIYTLLFEIAPTLIIIAATLHILFIARKLSIQMSTLLTQVRFNLAANSATIINAPIKVGLKASTVRMVASVVAVFVACYGTEIYVSFCETPFNLCEVSSDTRTLFSLLLMVNSVLNPVVYAFLKQDIKRETRALFRRRKDNSSKLTTGTDFRL